MGGHAFIALNVQNDGTLVTAIFACTGSPAYPPYAVLLTARVPTPLAGDLGMVNYLVHSFTCQPPVRATVVPVSSSPA